MFLTCDVAQCTLYGMSNLCREIAGGGGSKKLNNNEKWAKYERVEISEKSM